MRYFDYCGIKLFCFGENFIEINLLMDCFECICMNDCEMFGRCCFDKFLSKCVRLVYFIDGYIFRFVNIEKYWFIFLCF